jgi:hypothetical protein
VGDDRTHTPSIRAAWGEVKSKGSARDKLIGAHVGARKEDDK